MENLRLHQKYGLNPTIPVCFLCGKPKNEVALLEASYKDKAPMHMVINKDPCEECRNLMKQGILLIRVKNNTDKENPYRLGQIAVIKEDAAKKIFNNLGEQRAAFVEDSVWKKIGLPD